MPINLLRYARITLALAVLVAVPVGGAMLAAKATAQAADTESDAKTDAKADTEGDDGAAKAEGASMSMGGDTSSALSLLGATGGELGVLRRLADRRNALAAREAKLAERETFVAAMEVKLAEQASDLQRLRAELAEQEAAIAGSRAEKDEAAEARIQSLAKAYKTMKPKDAARLFNELEADLLIGIAREISPRALAPIMSRMKPDKARALTQALTES